MLLRRHVEDARRVTSQRQRRRFVGEGCVASGGEPRLASLRLIVPGACPRCRLLPPRRRSTCGAVETRAASRTSNARTPTSARRAVGVEPSPPPRRRRRRATAAAAPRGARARSCDRRAPLRVDAPLVLRAQPTRPCSIPTRAASRTRERRRPRRIEREVTQQHEARAQMRSQERFSLAAQRRGRRAATMLTGARKTAVVHSLLLQAARDEFLRHAMRESDARIESSNAVEATLSTVAVALGRRRPTSQTRTRR